MTRLAERNAAAAAALEKCRLNEGSGETEAQIPIESIGHAAELFISLGSEVEVLTRSLCASDLPRKELG